MRAYERTSENAPLRQVLVAGLCQFDDESENLKQDLPAPFLLDMVKYLLKETRQSDTEYPVYKIPKSWDPGFTSP